MNNLPTIEDWRPVLGHEGHYEVSNLGRVRSLRRKTPRVLQPGRASNGYLTVALGRGNSRTVHSLVAEAFLGQRPAGGEVLHLDGTRTNNALENLRWGTRSDNMRDAVRHGTHWTPFRRAAA